jgi:hypothetical protein
MGSKKNKLSVTSISKSFRQRSVDPKNGNISLPSFTPSDWEIEEYL